MPFLGSNLSQLRDFVGHLGNVKGDLSNITAPPFILAPKSAIEIPGTWASAHSLFLRPAQESDPSKRALLLLKNYICSLRQLTNEDATKKPLNPFLGEIFLGSFKTGESFDTSMVAEQVSHHPPVTACFIHNQKHGISSSGFVAQETSFSLSDGVTVRQHGFAVVSDEKHDEKHLMTMPTLRIKGLTTGKTYVDLEGPCYISSSSGFLSKISFKGPSTFGFGGRDVGGVSAEVFDLSTNTSTPIFKVKGKWHDKLNITDGSNKTIENLQVDKEPTVPISVRPIEEQSEWESRRVWNKVIEGVREGNFDKVVRHKGVIEDSQRQRRNKEAESGIEWQSTFFTRCKSDEQTLALLRQIPDAAFKNFDPSLTDGFWKFRKDETTALLNSIEKKDG